METVILGLSGGVDSSVAAELLKREYRVLALYLENGAPGGQEAARAAAAAALCLAGPAFADIAVEPEPTPGADAPLIVALVLVAAVAVILVSAFIVRKKHR